MRCWCVLVQLPAHPCMCEHYTACPYVLLRMSYPNRAPDALGLMLILSEMKMREQAGMDLRISKLLMNTV